MYPQFTPSDVARFWSKLDRSGDCWLWTGSCFRDGYGQFWLRPNRNLRAHRVAWYLCYGPLADGLCVLHQCDHPACCRPSHLFAGTMADNNADKLSKGHYYTGDAHYFHQHPEELRGERNGRAKITATDALAIYQAAGTGTSIASLAREYGLGTSQISRIAYGQSWAHVTLASGG